MKPVRSRPRTQWIDTETNNNKNVPMYECNKICIGFL